MQSPIRVLLYGIAIWFVWVSLVVTAAQVLPAGIVGSPLFVSMQTVALATLVLGSTILYLSKVGEGSFKEGFLVGLGGRHDRTRPRALGPDAGDGPRHWRSPRRRRADVRRRADHHDADDGIPRAQVPPTGILNVSVVAALRVRTLGCTWTRRDDT